MSGGTHNPRKALGKGLSALLPEKVPPPRPVPAEGQREGIQQIPIDLIDPNPLQPRSVFQPERLNELAQSIQASGIIQPLIVRPHEGRYQLVAGERRWRAARIAGLTEVPALVKEFPSERLLEITLVENIQREDLNPIEVAHAFERLGKDLKLTHEQIAQRTGKDRATITNTLRLLRLPPDVQELVAERRLSMGHARAILGLPTPDLQRQVAEKASAQGLSVRQVERLTQKMTETREPKSVEDVTQDPNVKDAIRQLESFLGTRVRVVPKGENRGKLEIDYYSQEDLDRIWLLILGEARLT